MLITTTAASQLAMTTDVTRVQSLVNEKGWQWFRAHQNDVIFSKRVVFFTVNITINQLRPLFESMFGAETVV
jgi:hypothetical protein